LTKSELEKWTEAHLTTAIHTRRMVGDDFQMMCAVTNGEADVVAILDVSKEMVPSVVAHLVKETQTVALAIISDTWMAFQKPGEYDLSKPVRELPDRQEAMVVVATTRDHQCMASSRYARVGDELCFEEPEIMPGTTTSRFFDEIVWPEEN
jgi:hypothetical protein